MRFFRLLPLSSLFLGSVLSQTFLNNSNPPEGLGLVDMLSYIGCSKFGRLLVATDPNLIRFIQSRNDVTLWAPQDSAVDAYLAKQRKRGDSRTSAQGSGTKPAPKRRRQVEGPKASNFETIYTFLYDYVKFGYGLQGVRFVKNYASPNSTWDVIDPKIQITTGLGDKQNTLRGPYKFNNGVIYEVNDFFTLPESFTATTKHISLSPNFYNRIVETGNLKLFEGHEAVTIFMPIDSLVAKYPDACDHPYNSDPRAHIVVNHPLYRVLFSPELIPSETIKTVAGVKLKVTFAPHGERLINCRRLLKANIPITNGVIHFIDGPLFGADCPTDYGQLHNFT